MSSTKRKLGWIAYVGIALAVAGSAVAVAKGWFWTRVEATEHVGEFKTHKAKPAHDHQLKWNESHESEMKEQRKALQTMNENIIRLQVPSKRRGMGRIEFEEEEP